MERVVGIGGLFFRAKDPEALAPWYRDHLGIDLVPTTCGAPPWKQEAGATVLSPFPEDTEYVGKPERKWMVNYRVRDLDRMVQEVRTAGVSLEVDAQECPNGRFARLYDPEGNPLELWQPMEPASSRSNDR